MLYYEHKHFKNRESDEDTMTNHKKLYQRGEAMTVVVVILVMALIGALGFIAWQNFGKKDEQKEEPRAQQEEKAAEQPVSEETPKTFSYVDLRTNKEDGTGVVIKTAADVDTKLSAAGDKLKAYLKKNVGATNIGPDGKRSAASFTVDRVYGDYAAGFFGPSAYEIVGPKDGDGAVEVVAGSQNLAMPYDSLVKAKVPKELVDSRALRNGEVVTYMEF